MEFYLLQGKSYIIISYDQMKNCLFGANSLRIHQGNTSLSNYSVDLLQQSYNIPKSVPLIKNVVIPVTKREEQLKIYEWRSKTEFPIIKVLDFALVEETNNSSVVQIKVEGHLTTLGEVHQLPLFKVLYLLKEAIIGFQRLLDKFGPFLLTPSMIIINDLHKCKVWINQNPYSNNFLKIQMSQLIFLRSICRIFEQRSNKLKNTTKFFLEISKKQTFYEALSFIEIYAKKNRINIPQSCKILLSEKIDHYKITGNKNVPTPLNNFPKFIRKAEMRLSLKAAACKRFIPCHKEGSWNANKSGGDTAPDIENSRSQKLAKSIYQDRVLEVKATHTKMQDPGKVGVFKSEVPLKISPISSFSFGRKYNSNIEFLSEIKSLNLPSARKKQADDEVEATLKKQTSFGQINDEQNEQTTKIKQEEAYNRNRWQRSIKFLLNDLNVKSSVHLGQDVRKTQKCAIKLERLDTIGQKVTQSFINMPAGTERQVDSILFTTQI